MYNETIFFLEGGNIMNIGIIGCGNMGSAIITSMITTNFVASKQVFVYDKATNKANDLKDKLGLHISPDPMALAKKVDILILAVKPNVSQSLLQEIKGSLSSKQLVVSIMAGITIDTLEKELGKDKKIIRVMPNTPALVQAAMSAISANGNVLDSELKTIVTLFQQLGKAEVVDETLMDIVTGISGSSPAYVFMMIEAMADAAVQGGMPRDKAYLFVAQAIMGSAKMVLETNLHPGVLKDMVTSPAGTTIDAVAALEKNGFRNSLIKAVEKATKKSKELGKK